MINQYNVLVIHGDNVFEIHPINKNNQIDLMKDTISSITGDNLLKCSPSCQMDGCGTESMDFNRYNVDTIFGKQDICYVECDGSHRLCNGAKINKDGSEALYHYVFNQPSFTQHKGPVIILKFVYGGPHAGEQIDCDDEDITFVKQIIAKNQAWYRCNTNNAKINFCKVL